MQCECRKYFTYYYNGKMYNIYNTYKLMYYQFNIYFTYAYDVYNV